MRRSASSKNEDLFDPFLNLKAAHQMAYSRDNAVLRLGSDTRVSPPPTTPMSTLLLATSRRRASVTLTAYVPPMAASPGIGGGNMHFNNTFVIQGGSGGGGIDTRRVVTQLADQLESEMRRRMARSN